MNSPRSTMSRISGSSAQRPGPPPPFGASAPPGQGPAPPGRSHQSRRRSSRCRRAALPSGPGPRPAPPGTPAPPPGGWSLRHPRRRRQTHPMPPARRPFPETAAGSAGGPGCRTRRYGPPPGILPPPWGRNAPPSGPEGARFSSYKSTISIAKCLPAARCGLVFHSLS